MLVLSRKAEQTIRVGDNVVITILQVKGNTVRIGIEAPRDVRVMRGELEPKVEATAANEMTIELATSADMLPSAPEMLLPAMSGSTAPAFVRSSSLRQEPVDGRRRREERSSPLLRFMAAGAATDAPSESPIRDGKSSRSGARLTTAR